MIQDLGRRMWSLGPRGFKVSGCEVLGLTSWCFGVRGSGLWAEGLGLGVWGLELCAWRLRFREPLIQK